jgi:hypothetical protein
VALNYTTIPVQLGGLLKVSRALRAVNTFARLSSDASHFSRLLSATNGFGQTDTEEKNVYSSFTELYTNSIADAAAQSWKDHRSLIESEDGFFGLLMNDLSASDEKDAGGAIDYEYEDIDGAITIIARNGIWGALRREMLADGYYVTPNVITVGAIAAKSGNRGTLAKTSLTGESHCLTGTLVVTVVNESVTAPKLKIVNVLTTSTLDGETSLEADNYLTCEKNFEDGELGINTVVLTRSGLAAPTETGDGGNILSSSSISTPKEGDMNGGVLQVRIVRQATAPIWLIEFYSSSARTTRVGSTTLDGTTSTGAIDTTLKNGTRFQSTFDKAAADTALPAATNEDNDISFDIKTPREGDRWTIAVSSNNAGNYATELAQQRRVNLPGTGSSLFTDSNAAAISITG